MDFLLVDTKSGRKVGAPPVDHLARGPDRQLVAIPCGDRSEWLHHRMRLVGRRIAFVETDGGLLEGPLEVPDRRILLVLGLLRFDRAGHSVLQVERTLPFGVIDLDQGGR